MGQASLYLRNTREGFLHYCPGCDGVHEISIRRRPDNTGIVWDFNGDVNRPTFSPSVKVTYNGRDADADRGDGYRAPAACCHYFLRGGVIEFCSDSTHSLAGQTVPLPELPDRFKDGAFHVPE